MHDGRCSATWRRPPASWRARAVSNSSTFWRRASAASRNCPRRLTFSIANTSQHLQQLRRAGIVSRRRKGRQILYDLADARVLDLMAILRGMAEANHAVAQRTVDHWYHARDALAPVTSDELTERLRRRSVRLIDVRPEIEYRA